MDLKMRWLLILSVVFGAGFILFSSLIQTMPFIWYQTRVLGLLAFVLLFCALLLGESRMLAMEKSKVTIFRFHKPLATFAGLLALLHGISAVFEKYMWGKTLVFVQYLGLSFSSHWLLMLSLGTLSFYIITTLAISSQTKSIQKIGFKKWKLIHYLSYGAFTLAYIHSMNLGTDVKTSFLSPYLSVIFPIMFAIIMSLFVARVLKTFMSLQDHKEITLLIIFAIVFVVGIFLLVNTYSSQDMQVQQIQSRVQDMQYNLTQQQTRLVLLYQNITGVAHG